MKNKGVTYALIAVVVLVWYQVFIRVKSNVMSEDVVVAASGIPKNQSRLKKQQDFTLRADYRDPFTGNLSNITDTEPVVTSMPLQANPIPREPKPQPAPIQWPAIKYYGIVRKTTSNLPRTLLSIDGTNYHLKQGDAVLDDILVKKTYRDSVVIRYKNKDRMFYKSGK